MQETGEHDTRRQCDNSYCIEKAGAIRLEKRGVRDFAMIGNTPRKQPPQDWAAVAEKEREGARQGDDFSHGLHINATECRFWNVLVVLNARHQNRLTSLKTEVNRREKAEIC